MVINISYSLLNIYEQIRHNIVLYQGRAQCSLLSDGEADALMVHLKICSIESHQDWVTSCDNLQQNDGVATQRHTGHFDVNSLIQKKLKIHTDFSFSVKGRTTVCRDSRDLVSGKLNHTQTGKFYEVIIIWEKTEYFLQINPIHCDICHIKKQI